MKRTGGNGLIKWTFLLLLLSTPSSSFVVADDASENGNAEQIGNERPMLLQVIEQLPVRADPTRCNGEWTYYHPPTQKCVSCVEVCTPDVHSPSCRANCKGWCPPGWIFHPPTDQCMDCALLCGEHLESEEVKRFCKVNCGNARNSCFEHEFYYRFNRSCLSCQNVCQPGNFSLFCTRNCITYVQHLRSTLTTSVQKTNEAAQISAPIPPRDLHNNAEDSLIPSPAYLCFIAVPVIVLVVIFVLVYVKYHQKDSRTHRTRNGHIIALETGTPGGGMFTATEKESQVQREWRVCLHNRIHATGQYGSSAVAPNRPGECAKVYRGGERPHNQLPHSTRVPVSHCSLSIIGSAPASGNSVGGMDLSLKSEYEPYGDKTEKESLRAWRSA